jgi:hypothetical protein
VAKAKLYELVRAWDETAVVPDAENVFGYSGNKIRLGVVK